VRRIGPGFVIFLIAAIYVWHLAGDLFSLGVDEGIYLEGGRRVARGEVPYRDFHVFTGPLTFWIEGGLARISHADIRAMRIPMALDVALLTWCVYRIAAQFAGSLFSAGLSLTFLVYIGRVNRLVVNHRWDSGALAAAAIVAALAAERRDSRTLWFVAGAVGSLAAWATPPVALAGLALLVWASWRGASRAVAFLAGGALVTAAMIGTLAAQGALAPMLESLRWTATHYAPANRMRYGTVILSGGGPPSRYRWLLTLHYAVPAILMPAALIGWAWRRRLDKDRFVITALLGASTALALSAWPRWTATQMVFVAAPGFALMGVWLERSLARGWRAPVFTLLAIFLLAPPLRQFTDPRDYHSFPTRVGAMRGTAEDESFLRQLEARVPRGSSLFVFPYLPALYYYLDARNPTRYSFLQPGMMDSSDEGKAIGDLVASRPERVLVLDMPPSLIHLMWPGTDPSKMRMEGMQAYLAENYRGAGQVIGNWGSIDVLERR
jgi:hypothetical protein